MVEIDCSCCAYERQNWVTDKSELVAAYNDGLLKLAAARIAAGGTRDLSYYADTLIPYFTEDVILSEPATLPWGGLWHGRAGLQAEVEAFGSVFKADYVFEGVSDAYVQADENTVFHDFRVKITRRVDPSTSFLFRGVERYDFTGDKCSYLDVFYKDTAGLMQFIGVSPRPQS